MLNSKNIKKLLYKSRKLLVIFMVLGISGIVSLNAGAARVECFNTNFSCLGGGYYGASTWGYPVTGGGHNCTNYAAYRLSKNGASNPGNLGNAANWANNARYKGFTVNNIPVAGSIAQWNAYTPGGPSQYGHVAYVEAVYSDRILITESNWSGTWNGIYYPNGWGSKRTIYRTGDNQWPSNFIHIRDIQVQIQPDIVLSGPQPVYRLISAIGNHFYTANTYERDYIIANLGFRLEGIAYYAYRIAEGNASQPVFRLYSESKKGHFYTIDAFERDQAVKYYGYRYEGIAFYASNSTTNKPIYRLLSSKEHFYTSDSLERDIASTKYGYKYEGIGFYAY
jgi:surface antigen